MEGNIILDCQIKTCDDWVAGVKFHQETLDMRAQSATAPHEKNINDLHVEIRHPSKSIAHATAKTFGIQVTGTFKPYEDCALGKAKQCIVNKKTVPQSKILGDRLFFNTSFSLLPLLAIRSTGYSF